MKKRVFFLLFYLVCSASFAKPALQPVSVAKPKLVVGIVVDQMRADFIYRYWAKYGNGGFKRLVNQGFFFKDAHYNYVPTYTCPGHASIYTGTTPAVHGIIGNDWPDTDSDKKHYCVSDASVQSIGGNEKAGRASPKKLLTTTIGDQLKLSNQSQSKVISVAWKDRSAILPGGHLANGAYWFDTETGNWITSSYYMAQLPEWVNRFNSQQLAATYLSKSWKTLLPANEYSESLNDDNDFEKAFDGEEKPVFPHDLPKLAAQNKNFALLKATPFANTLTKEFTIQAIQAENLGKHAHPDMLTVSFSATDYIGHQFGPHSVEAEDAYLRLDRDLAELLGFLDKWLGKEQILVFLTADHGAMETPAYLSSLKIPSGIIKEKEFSAAIKNFLQTKYGHDLLLNYLNQQVFLDHNKIADLKLSANEVTEALADFLMTMEGVAATVTKQTLLQNEFSSGINHYIQLGYNPQRSGDVVVSYQPGWIESGSMKGTTHGSPYHYDTHIPLVWYGWKIAAGESLQRVEITDIASTLALLLDIQAPNGSFGKFLPLSVK